MLSYKIPRVMSYGNYRLRPLMIFDASLTEGFMEEGTLSADKKF